MKILQKTPEKLVFITNIGESLANAIRRSASEIPILAIDEVEFYKNDSAINDEMLALRLGLIPFETPKDMELPDECSCKGKGCSKCTIQIKLVAKGPKTVYSKDLEGKAEVVFPEMPIVELSEDQELELVAFLRLGKGIVHTKYSPGLVFYRNLALCKNCASKRELLKIEGDGREEKLELTKCDLCGEHITGEAMAGKELIFFIESWGQIKAEEILLQAIKSIKLNLKALK